MIAALLRERLRRDRLQVPLWILGTALMAYAGYAGVTQSYGTVAQRADILAAAIANPVILMLRGLPSGTSEGAFLAFEVLPWLAILAALMSTFLAVRHTRGDEEAGRGELVAATPAGRIAPALATGAHGIGANLVLAAVTALVLLGCGMDAAGSLIAAAATGATGLVFLGIGLVAAQLVRTGRAANAVTVWIVVGTFLVRGLGNAAGTPATDLSHVHSAWPVWLSPFGWAEQARPFDADSWWPVILSVAAGLALSAAAVGLQSVRDMGAGLINAPRARAQARPALASSHALVWRLTGAGLIGWIVAGALTGIMATTLTGLVSRVSGANPAVTAVLEKLAGGGSVEQAVVTVFFTMLGVLAACAGVQTVARARLEEAHGTAEPVLAAPVGRVHWLVDYLIVGGVAVALVVAAAMLAGYLGIAGRNGPSSLYRLVTISGLGQFLAALVFVALTALILVLAPRATIGAGWTLLLLATLLGMFGPLFGLPDAATHLSPFAVTPLAHGAGVDLRGTWWLVLAIIAGTAASVALMRRRELATAG